MTKQEKFYNKLIKKFPQLVPYAHLGRGGVHVGSHGGDIHASAINVGEVDIDVRGKPAPANTYMELLSKSNDIINTLEPHIDEMLKMIQDFEKTANPQREFDMLKNLGFDVYNDRGSLKIEDVAVDVAGPYNRSGTLSTFRGRLNISKGRNIVYGRYFNTLDELLDYIVDGV